jgi:predicted DNA-binding protein (MmcQ/YjbR family)
MDNERIRKLCLALPHVTETVNWGHHLVYWVGDRAKGGKMFAMTDLDGTGTGVLWFHCGGERFHELVEIEGIIPAPYLARAHWVTVERWAVLQTRQYEEELRHAHDLILSKVPKRVARSLEIPEPQRVRAVSGQSKRLTRRTRKTAAKGSGRTRQGRRR